MIKHTLDHNVFKYDYHTIKMEMRGYYVGCMISNSQSKDFNTNISFIKLNRIVTIL